MLYCLAGHIFPEDGDGWRIILEDRLRSQGLPGMKTRSIGFLGNGQMLFHASPSQWQQEAGQVRECSPVIDVTYQGKALSERLPG